jgi:hypothetical protein
VTSPISPGRYRSLRTALETSLAVVDQALAHQTAFLLESGFEDPMKVTDVDGTLVLASLHAARIQALAALVQLEAAL